MKFREEIIIDAPSDKVWEYVGSLDCWSLFHSKVGECRQVSSQDDGVGAVYEMEFRLGSKPNPTRCEIEEYRIGTLISVRSEMIDMDEREKPMHTAVMTFALEDRGMQTKVTETLDADFRAVPFWLKPLIWLITRLGKPVGETTLMKLKRVVEA